MENPVIRFRAHGTGWGYTGLRAVRPGHSRQPYRGDHGLPHRRRKLLRPDFRDTGRRTKCGKRPEREKPEGGFRRDVPFPTRWRRTATLAGHLTPSLVKRELSKLGPLSHPDLPVPSEAPLLRAAQKADRLPENRKSPSHPSGWRRLPVLTAARGFPRRSFQAEGKGHPAPTGHRHHALRGSGSSGALPDRFTWGERTGRGRRPPSSRPWSARRTVRRTLHVPPSRDGAGTDRRERRHDLPEEFDDAARALEPHLSGKRRISNF